MKRVLCLYMPQLAIERLREVSAPPGPEPVVVIGQRRGLSTVVQADPAAMRLGVRPGMTVAEACALVPGIRARSDDPLGNRQTLEALADWAYRFSPIVHTEDAETLLLDVTGCERLFGGEPSLVRRAVEGLREQGFTTRAALADTPGAAWALAHAHYEDTILVAPGRTAAALAPLPIWALRIDPSVVSALASVGVERIETLLHLPRSSVAARFGADILRRLDQALGEVPELLTPFRPPPPLKTRLFLGGPTDRWDILREAADHLVATFCEQLAARAGGVRRVSVTFYGDEGGPYTLDVSLSQATRSAQRLRRLVTTRLEGIRLPAPVHTVMLWTQHVEPLDARQEELFEPGPDEVEGLAELIDRLSVRLGAECVVRPELVSDHQPEKAYGYRPAVCADTMKGNVKTPKRQNAEKAGLSIQECEARRHEGTEAQRETAKPGAPSSALSPQSLEPIPRPLSPLGGEGGVRGVRDRLLGRNERAGGEREPRRRRPVWLLARPIRVTVMALVPDGPPVGFRWNHQRYEIVDSAGPERIETGWWRGDPIRRDYFRVTSSSGSRFWLFHDRDASEWFLHGLFD